MTLFFLILMFAYCKLQKSLCHVLKISVADEEECHKRKHVQILEVIFSYTNRCTRSYCYMIFVLNVLTNEGENGGEDQKHATAVHGERDSKVGSQATPHKKLVYGCPGIGVNT